MTAGPSHERSPRIIAIPVATMRTLTFLAGLGLTIAEGITGGPEHPSRYVLYATMMGLSLTTGNGQSIAKLFQRDEKP